ncbi:MAG: GNAT family N-acetyltransferase [Candidatus Saccharimonadales bacterium]
MAETDREAYSPHLASALRDAWTQRYVHELGAATLTEVDQTFTEQTVLTAMADISALKGNATYLTAELVDNIRYTSGVCGFVRTARYQPPGRSHVAYPYIKDIDVVSSLAGQGIGSVLMDRILSQFPEDRRVALYVHAVNTPSRQWYERLGFVARRTIAASRRGGAFALDLVHMEAPSVGGVREALVPTLGRAGYRPAHVDPGIVAANA